MKKLFKLSRSAESICTIGITKKKLFNTPFY